jgi:hypothetical protein
VHRLFLMLALHCKYMQWNYSEDTSKNCKTELQFFYCNMDKYFAIHNTMQKCRFKFTVITLHLEQQSNVKNTVKNCNLDYSYSTVLCTFLSCVPYLQCRKTIDQSRFYSWKVFVANFVPSFFAYHIRAVEMSENPEGRGRVVMWWA